MTYLYIFSGSALDIFVTWVLGLSVPLALLAIVRRPFSRIWALVLTGSLWLLNIITFTLLGSQSRTHVALFLVAITTYCILFRGIGPKAFITAVYSLLIPSSVACFLWLKYLRRRRIVFLSIAAVALSVSLLIVVASLFSGFINAFERSAVDMLGDVVISSQRGDHFQKCARLIDQLERIEAVEAATGTLSSKGLLHVGIRTGNVRPVSIWGIEPARRARVTGFKNVLLRQADLPGQPSFDVPERPDVIGAFAGIGIVAEPNEETDEYDQGKALKDMVGQRVLITTGTVETDSEGDETPKRKLIPFHLADVVFSGVHDLDTGFVYVPIETLQETLYPQEDAPASSVNIKLKAGVDPEAAVVQIRGLWRAFTAQELGWSNWRIDNFEVLTAHEMQRHLVLEFRKQMGILLLIFGAISFSAVILVFCIFYMIVRLKRRDIAIIKSCGAASVSVAWIFLGFGVTVGVLGAGIGAVLGYIITKNINVVENGIRVVLGLNLWSSSVYMFDKIPNEMDWGWTITFMLLAVAAAALGALTPAIVAALTKPVEVLRYD